MENPQLAAELAKRVLAIRIRLQMTVPEFARHCNLHHSTIYDVEDSKCLIKLCTIIRICESTKTPYNDFMGCLKHLVPDLEDKIIVK